MIYAKQELINLISHVGIDAGEKQTVRPDYCSKHFIHTMTKRFKTNMAVHNPKSKPRAHLKNQLRMRAKRLHHNTSEHSPLLDMQYQQKEN